MAKQKQKPPGSENARKIIMEMFQPIVDLVVEPETRAAKAETSLQAAMEKLERIKKQKCPDCSKPLAIDGVCYYCQIKNFPTGDLKKSYARGAKDIFQALMAFTLRNENGVHSSYFDGLLKSCWDNRLEPDRKAAAEKARADSMNTRNSAQAAYPTTVTDWLE